LKDGKVNLGWQKVNRGRSAIPDLFRHYGADALFGIPTSLRQALFHGNRASALATEVLRAVYWRKKPDPFRN